MSRQALKKNHALIFFGRVLDDDQKVDYEYKGKRYLIYFLPFLIPYAMLKGITTR